MKNEDTAVRISSSSLEEGRSMRSMKTQEMMSKWEGQGTMGTQEGVSSVLFHLWSREVVY